MQSFVVIGIGRFGNALAKELFNDGHEVLVIDPDQDKIQKIADSVTHAVIGDATDPAVLESIGVRNFDCAIVSIASNVQDSILVTLHLKEMGVSYVIAKARDAMHTKVLEKIGADKVVFPEHEMGQRLAQVITLRNVVDYLELSDDYSIMEVKVPKCWDGKTLTDIDVRAKYKVTVLAVRHPDTDKLTISLSANFVVSSSDIIVVLGKNADIEVINKL